MKAEKRHYYFTKILECLLDEDVLTTQRIAEKVRISKKTARTKLIEVNEYLHDNSLGSIQKKPRIGIWLECSDEQRKRIIHLLYDQSELLSIQNNEERVYDVLSYIFKNRKKEIITSAKLANYLFLSVPTILKTLKDCELFLSEYNIILKNTRLDGIIIIFNESNYRNVLKKIIMRGSKIKSIEKNILDILPGVPIGEVKRIMLEVESEWKFEFSDDSFYEILVYYCMAIHRCNKGTFKIDKKDYGTLEQYNEYTFAKAIFEKIETVFQLSFSKDEVHFLVIQILCSRFLGDNIDLENEEVLKTYDKKLIDFTEEIISYASDTLSSNLTKDKVLKTSLLIHLRATLFRIEYGKPTANSLIYFIKKEYKHLFRKMWGLSVLFEKHFNFKVTEDELGFICLYLQAALDRNMKALDILLVSNQNNSANQFIIQKLHKLYPELQEIRICVSHDFMIHKYDEYKIILTMVPLPYHDNRIIEILDFVGEEWVHPLSKKLQELSFLYHGETLFDARCHKLFDPDLIVLNLECSNKEEVLRLMSKKMENKGIVSKKFVDSVLEREEATTTEVGNGIALPHGNQFYVNEPKVMIAILDKPIRWNLEDVDIVLLLAMRMISEEEKKQAMLFYKQYVSMVESNEKIRILKKMGSNLDLYRYLIK